MLNTTKHFIKINEVYFFVFKTFSFSSWKNLGYPQKTQVDFYQLNYLETYNHSQNIWDKL